MGREAHCIARVGPLDGPVRALLESRELILRGDVVRGRYAIADLRELRVSDAGLEFVCDDVPVVLDLGQHEAARWLEKIRTPPPSLAAKLGISADRPALVTGHSDDPALRLALAGATTDDDVRAALLLAIVADDDALQQALARHAHLRERPLWIVHGKGRHAYGEASVRAFMRPRGYVDTKCSAISDRLSATRYVWRSR